MAPAPPETPTKANAEFVFILVLYLISFGAWMFEG
jgi:hypothetical protein